MQKTPLMFFSTTPNGDCPVGSLWIRSDGLHLWDGETWVPPKEHRVPSEPRRHGETWGTTPSASG